MTKSVSCRAYRGRGPLSRARALGAVLAAGLGAAVLTVADAAQAQFYRYGSPYYSTRYYYDYYPRSYYARPYYTRPRLVAPADPYYQKPRRKAVEPAKKDPIAKPQGPLLIAISLNKQRLTLYSGGAAVAHSPVSTGTPSHPTPTGIFSVIGKERFHRSNLYSNAPMPFMQRITWSGVALHQGVLPGYPASHGCIRLPGSFAQYLYGTTRMGARVIIADDEVTPFDIAHAKLFAPKRNQEQEPVADAVPANRPLQIAESDDPVQTSDAPKPVGLGTSELDGDRSLLKGLLDARFAETPGETARSLPAGRTRTARELGDRVDAPARTALEATTAGEAAESINKPARPADKEVKDTPRMSEPVSVFVSRKTGRLYVRQGFEPLFETAVTIRDAHVPLGTHLYTATRLKEDRTAMQWVAVTLADGVASEPETRRNGKKRERQGREDAAPPAPVPASARLAAAAALDRVEIPQDAVDRVSHLLSPGATLIISDHPLSHETGKYTDFIILTR